MLICKAGFYINGVIPDMGQRKSGERCWVKRQCNY